IRCVPGSPDSGLDAMVAAGFSYEFVPQQVGFVCQINGYPNPCNGAPADAYWSLWIVQSDSWTYSNVGVATLQTPVDSVLAWVFGAGQPPSSNPLQLGANFSSSTTSWSAAASSSAGGNTTVSKGSTEPPGDPSGPTATLFALGLVGVAAVWAFWMARARQRRAT
ncbi:MAG: hypothetical protein LBO75_04780, partial [Bifidobacteriaceae bacterium]|nr:hypothetical protein [Bifidobacteriaceae bacterium]